MKKTLLIFILIFSSVYAAFADMPLDKISSRLVMVGFKASSYDDADLDILKYQIEKGIIAGVVLYGYNIDSREQTRKLIAELNAHNHTDIPLLIAVDEEGGRVQRLTSAKGFHDEQSPQYISEHYSPEQAEKIYEQMAKDLADAGFNMNFAPVVDLNVNPQSPVIGAIGRSYGADTDTVVKYAEAFIRAHRKFGVLTCLKHFSGHGSAMTDSHMGFTDVTDTWDKKELEPYKALIKDGYADMIMTAHVFNAKIDPKYPATLSKKHMSMLQDIGYNGIIISDDLQMGAINDNFGFDETVKKAVEAGNDILLFSNYFFYEKRYPEKVRKVLESE
ncbi:MAG: glycoside hydrolase family 3 N-terminal domain-containing protein [Deferribacterales bacterium]